MSAAYQSLHINSSRQRTEFSDFPMPKHYPDFPHHTQMLAYFEQYVDHFDLRQRITFRSTVERVRPVGPEDFEVTWLSTAGGRQTRHYRAVLVASGHHWCPRYPDFPGEFTGQVMHTHDYRTCDG